MIAERILGKKVRISEDGSTAQARLVAGGSVLKLAKNFDTVWGAGVRDADCFKNYLPRWVDIRAVRGPLTRDCLRRAGKFDCPDTLGDPSLLLPQLFPEWKKKTQKGKVGVVPHFRNRSQFQNLPAHMVLIDPTQRPEIVVPAILDCEFIISSSLHGIIIAEVFGIPARWFPGQSGEPEFKYLDYYFSTLRTPRAASSLSEAEDWGGEPAFQFNTEPLLKSFPRDLNFDYV